MCIRDSINAEYGAAANAMNSAQSSMAWHSNQLMPSMDLIQSAPTVDYQVQGQYPPVGQSPLSKQWAPPQYSRGPPLPSSNPNEVSMLQNLSSELASIRQSINDLRRTHSDTSTPQLPGDPNRAQVLSDAITRLASSRLPHEFPEFVPPTQLPGLSFPQVVEPAMLPLMPTPTAPVLIPNSEDIMVPPDPDHPESQAGKGMDKDNLKKLVRKQRNRQAAQNSRLRKKMRLEELEENLDAMMAQNHKYQRACEELTRRNQELEQQIQELTSMAPALANNLQMVSGSAPNAAPKVDTTVFKDVA
eukprot:TRINITY_DN5370_c0_g1_i1.p1 TRINITY_DN5370_c0_g1~~TRINITY_DN5370_c0_g1_i1.p1  ORF type:complete len:302 (+),score=65.45 TRINITY_DN5370_c0_g1_i1:180-1085(+)